MSVHFAFVASVSNEKRDANVIANERLCLPEHRGAGPLAVVGGGPSINDHIDELKSWPGTIWAVNGAINWCAEHGIDAWFYTIDAQGPDVWPYPLNNIKKAVLALDCDPGMFWCLEGARIETLPHSDGGPTSANAADWFSVQAGYPGCIWFGCEASFGESTHAFASNPISQWIDVKIGGKTFRTKPEFLEQARVMSEVIRLFPDFYSERSGGLLSAMVEHGMDYELTMISKDVERILIDRHEAITRGA